MNLREEAQNLCNNLKAAIRQADRDKDAKRALRLMLKLDAAQDRLERRMTACIRCGKQLEETEHTLCGMCFRVYECW